LFEFWKQSDWNAIFTNVKLNLTGGPIGPNFFPPHLL